MENYDLSKYSTEELERSLTDNASTSSKPMDLYSNPHNNSKSFGEAFLRGAGQSIGDTAASIINWPIEGIEKLTGKQFGRAPHPQFINENPGSMSENLGQMLGGLTGGLAIPGGAAVKGAHLANRGYQLLKGGKELGILGKTLAGTSAGALEGAAGYEPNRTLGAAFGGTVGGAAGGIPSAYNFAKSIKSENIANNIKNFKNELMTNYGNKFETVLKTGEEEGANNFLTPIKYNEELLKKGGDTKTVYAVEKYNNNPTLTNAHNAQSDLNKLVNKYSKSQLGTLERDKYDLALKLKNSILMKMRSAMNRSEGKLSEDIFSKNNEGLSREYQNTRTGYATEVEPYLNSPAIKRLTKKNPTIRDKDFVNAILQEKKFMKQASQNHPDLLRKEILNNFKKNKALIGGTIGAGIGMGVLPEFLSKLSG